MNLSLGAMPKELQDLAKNWPMVFQFRLPPKANIVVAGCYEGRVMNLLRWVYPDYNRLVGFDIQYEACNKARLMLGPDENVEIHNIGLYKTTAMVQPGKYGTVDTSVCQPSDTGSPMCDMREANEALLTVQLRSIDLMVLNMEGYEYHLIPHLLEAGAVDIDRFAVQFHPGLVNIAYNAIEKLLLDKGYRKVVDTGPQWVYFIKSGIASYD